MCEPTTIALAASAVGAGVSAYGSYQQGQVAKQVGRNNQIMAEYAAQDAIKRGEQEAINLRRQGDQMRGALRSRMAANGLDLGEGTPAELIDQADFFTQSDIATTRTNAAREAWSYRTQGNNAAAMGDAQASASNLQAFGTLLGGAGQVANKWYASKGR